MQKKVDLKNFENIIFDLGGVILNIDYSHTRNAFQALGIADFDSVYSQAKQSHLFDAIEKGEISESDFRKGLREIMQIEVSDVQLDNAWNAMLMDLPLSRLKLIEELKQERRIFLLSNTNAIHIRAFEKIVADTVEPEYFNSLFEQIFLSHVIHKRKPDAEVFEHVLEATGIDASKTLFIDDTIRHAEGAEKCGIKAYWLNNEDSLNIF